MHISLQLIRDLQTLDIFIQIFVTNKFCYISFYCAAFQAFSTFYHSSKCRCKDRLVVNSNTEKVKYIYDSIIFVQSKRSILPIFPVYDNGVPYYLIVAGCALTVHNIMGQTLAHVNLAFDLRKLLPAVGYVDISRLDSINNIVLLLCLHQSQFFNA